MAKAPQDESTLKKLGQKWLILVAVISALTSGSVVMMLTYFTDWVWMNSNPGVVRVSSESFEDVIINQTKMKTIVCDVHEAACEEEDL